MNALIATLAERPEPWLPWYEARRQDYPVWILYLFLFIVIVLVGGRHLRRYWERRKEHQARRRRVHRLAADKHLSLQEERALLLGLHSLNIVEPEDAVVSEGYFDRYLAPVIRTRFGKRVTDAICEKLFSVESMVWKKSAVLPSTRFLEVGQGLRMHVGGDANAMQAVVARVLQDGFLVAATDSASAGRVREGQRVEAVLDKDNALLSFKSTIEQVAAGEVPTYRIAHSDDVTEVHRRATTRVPVGEPIRFALLRGDEVAEAVESLGTLQDVMGRTLEGTLRNISLGGACIGTRASRSADAGDLVRFRFRPAPDMEPVVCFGRVLHVSEGPDRTRNLHVEFIGLDDAARNAIALAISRLRGAAGRA